MAKISTYQEDSSITGDDILLGSSSEGSFNGNTTYSTRNFKLSELASFFNLYDPDSGVGGSDLIALTNRVVVLENAGYLTEHPNITAGNSVDNSGQFFIQDITLDSNGHILSITSAEASGGGGGVTTETDPIYSASPAAGISSSNITSWNTAYGWGDHGTEGYLTTETDPTVPTHVKNITVTEVANWNTAYGWGDHSTQGYITSFTESDPTVASHVKNIAQSDITEWNSAYDNSIVSMSVTGTSTKTITLNQQDGGTVTASFTDISETGSGGITDTNDFVTSASLSSGTLTLGIPNQTSVTVSGFSELSSFSATNNSTATGDGSLAYNSNTGEFTYTPADFSGDFLSLNGGTINGDLTVTGIINVNSATGTSNFINDVSVDGNLSVDGTLTVGTITADVRGDVYSIVGATASTKVLESGSGSTPTAYFIGDLTTGDGAANMVFDTSLSMFRNHDVKIGDYNNSQGGGAENLDLYLGATSSIFFGSGTNQKEISATVISNLNFAIFSTITGVSIPNGVLTLRTKGADENEPGYSNYTVDLQTYFDGRYVELAGDTMTGMLQFNSENIGVQGDIYSDSGSKILQNGSSSQTAYLVGNLAGDIIESDLTTVVFDSSEGAFKKDIYLEEGSNYYDIILGYANGAVHFTNSYNPGSQTAPIESLTASKISIWDSNVITSTYYDLVNYDSNTQTGDIQLRIVKDNDPNNYITTSNNITGGTYINITSSENPGTESDGHDSNDPIVLDVNTTALDLLYVDIDGDTMSGMLQFSGPNGLAGNIYGDNLQTIILNNGTTSGSTYQEDSWFRGDLYHQGGALELSIGDTSNGPVFQRGLDITTDLDVGGDLDLTQNSNIVFDRGANQVSINKSDLSSIKNNVVENIKFEKVSNVEEIRLVIDNPTTTNLNSQTTIKAGAYINITADSNTPANPIITVDTGTNGLIAKSELSNFGVTSLTADGTVLNGAIEIIASNGLSVSGDGTDNEISIAAVDATTALKGVVLLADDNTANTGTDTTTAVTPASLAYTLSEQVTTPGISSVLAQDNDSSTEINLVGSQSTNGMFLVRRNDITGDNLIATFDTFGGSGHIRIGSDGSNNDNAITYGYLGMSATGNLFLSNNSSTSGGILIDSSDNVGIGAINNSYKFNVNGAARFSNTLLVENLASLQQGVNISNGTFQVASTTGNTTISGTLGVTNTTTLGTANISTIAVSTSSTFQGTATLETDLLPDATASNREIGASSAKFNKVHTTNLNDTPTVNLVNKTQSTTFVDGSTYKNVTAADFILASDVNLKENIIPLADRKIDVDFKEYNFKGSKRTRFGVIAQDIEEKHPEFVHTREGGDKTVSYIDLLVAKVHELENRIKELESASTR